MRTTTTFVFCWRLKQGEGVWKEPVLQSLSYHVQTKPDFVRGYRKLCPTLHLADPLPGQPFNWVWHTAAFTASTTQLAEVPVAPGPHCTILCQGKCLCVTTATRNVSHAVPHH